jgi:hypothetical protein
MEMSNQEDPDTDSSTQSKNQNDLESSSLSTDAIITILPRKLLPPLIEGFDRHRAVTA